MRNLYELRGAALRIKGPDILAIYGDAGDETCGVFAMPSIIDRAELRVIASSGEGWDHVSVSRRNRVPNWYELEQVKKAFFKPDEIALQFHVPQKDHVNNHPNCLHLWRPHGITIPLPSIWMV